MEIPNRTLVRKNLVYHWYTWETFLKII